MKHTFSNEFLPDGTLQTQNLGDGPTSTSYGTVQKRVVDLILCAFLIPIVAPVIAILALLARRDGGPAFFGHERIGRNGTPFRCFKIRTMVTDANERLQALLNEDPEAAAEWRRDRKLENDPRVTAIGGFLRRSSLDELPQLWNVLRGDMSLVGPRPVPRDELEENYGRFKWVYQTMRPGVTGLWQVSGRNDVSYAERVKMDVDYSKDMSLTMDLSIVAKTALAVLNRTGK